MSEKDFENMNENENESNFTDSTEQVTESINASEAVEDTQSEIAETSTENTTQLSEEQFFIADNEDTEENDAQSATEATYMGNGESYGGFSQKWNYERAEINAKKKNKGIKILAGVMSVLFVATLSAFATYYIMDKKTDTSENDTEINKLLNESGGVQSSVSDKIVNAPEIQVPTVLADYTGETLTSQEVIALAKPSVVGIKTMVEQYYGAWFGTQTYEGVGSGFIITSDGYIVTNAHVIDGAVSIKVILSDNTEYDAEVVGSDELADVAVLKIEAQELPALVIGNSDASLAGDTVIAIGCPSGIDLAGTATRGMISMVNREISITDSYGRVQKIMSVIQTDAAINSGNSGGPLLNMRGEVIGINTLKLSSASYEGIGFALPINGVMTLVDQICENGAVVERPSDSFVTGKAALGITYQEVSASMTNRYNLPQGVLVVLVSRDGAAQNAGIKSGDVIVEYDSKEITTDDELLELIDAGKPGDEVIVKVYRDGEYINFDVVLTESAE